jgi:hypothetical protein
VFQGSSVSRWKVLQQLSLSGAKMAERELRHGNARKEGPEDGGAEDQSSEGLEESRRKEIVL